MLQMLYFSAPWCAPCKTSKPIVQRVADELKVGLTIYNVDEDAREVQQYAISSVPTLVFMVNGQPVTSLLGSKITRDAVVGTLKQLGVK